MRIAVLLILMIVAVGSQAESDKNQKSREQRKRELLEKPLFQNNELDGISRQEKGAVLPEVGGSIRLPEEAAADDVPQVEEGTSPTQIVENPLPNPENSQAANESKQRGLAAKESQSQSDSDTLTRLKDKAFTFPVVAGLLAILFGFLYWRNRRRA